MRHRRPVPVHWMEEAEEVSAVIVRAAATAAADAVTSVHFSVRLAGKACQSERRLVLCFLLSDRPLRYMLAEVGEANLSVRSI